MPALYDLSAMQARLAELDAEREPLLALVRAAEAHQKVVGATLFDSPSGSVRQRQRPENGGRSAPVMEATSAAVAEILEILGPTTTGSLVDLVGDKPELGLTGDNRNNVLSARLSNSGQFKTRRKDGWWFKDRPWPDENGEAETSPDAEGGATPSFGDQGAFEDRL